MHKSFSDVDYTDPEIGGLIWILWSLDHFPDLKLLINSDVIFNLKLITKQFDLFSKSNKINGKDKSSA